MADPIPPQKRAQAKITPAQSRFLTLGLAFWEGFSTPSGLAFRAFCLALAASCGLCLWFFSETTLAGPSGKYLPRSPRDAEGFATHEALRAGHEVPDRPRLFILGSSTLAQTIGPGEVVRARIRAATGQDWEIVNLTTPLQAPTDQFALLEHALQGQRALSPPAVVILGFGVQRLRWSAAKTLDAATEPRLGLRSAWADAEISALGGTAPPRSGFYLRDNLGFVLINGSEALLRLALRSPARRRIDSYAAGSADGPPAPIRQEVRDLMGAEIRTAAARGGVRQLLAQTDRLARQLAAIPGTRLVLIEEPLSPAFVADQDLAGARAAFGRDLARGADGAADGAAFRYWPVAGAAGLEEADFFDDLHVYRGAPQTRFQEALADHLIGLIKAGEEAGDGG